MKKKIKIFLIKSFIKIIQIIVFMSIYVSILTCKKHIIFYIKSY